MGHAPRRHPVDWILVALALSCGVALCAAARLLAPVPFSVLFAITLWWVSNTISHIHLHRPLFKSRAASRLFSLYLTLLLSVPQALWRVRHLHHHARYRGGRGGHGEATPSLQSVQDELAAQGVALLLLWGLLWITAPRFLICAYLPGYLVGLLLCQAQGYFEHMGQEPQRHLGISYYGRLHNLLWFNDGFHAEHHLRPGAHWTRLPALQVAPAQLRVSGWPPLLRFAEPFLAFTAEQRGRLQALLMEWLERLPLRLRLVQRLMLRTHLRAFAHLLPRLPREPRRVGVVGGGLFPRTALVLQRLLPRCEVVIIEEDEGNLLRAQRFLAERRNPPTLQWVLGRFQPEHRRDFDVVVVPLGFRGDRAALYRRAPGAALLIHDWLWQRRGDEGVVVARWLLKRLNLVLP